jgi:hypothetical protein
MRRPETKHEGKNGFRVRGFRARKKVATTGGRCCLKALSGSIIYQAARFVGTVHMLFTYCPARPASGLRLEILAQIDKKKSELYFAVRVKKILTENVNRRLLRAQKKSSPSTLTELPHSRMVFRPEGRRWPSISPQK